MRRANESESEYQARKRRENSASMTDHMALQNQMLTQSILMDSHSSSHCHDTSSQSCCDTSSSSSCSDW